MNEELRYTINVFFCGYVKGGELCLSKGDIMDFDRLVDDVYEYVRDYPKYQPTREEVEIYLESIVKRCENGI